MNREIKFRGRRVDNNKWVFGQLIFKKCLRDNGGVEHMLREWEEEFAFIYEDNIENNCEEYPTKFIEVDIETIGQYVGLRDKNGVEIYEGDIIDIHQTVNGYNQFVIQYNNYKFSARYYNQKTKQILGWYEYDLDELFEIDEAEKEIEAIGNIYENEVD